MNWNVSWNGHTHDDDMIRRPAAGREERDGMLTRGDDGENRFPNSHKKLQSLLSIRGNYKRPRTLKINRLLFMVFGFSTTVNVICNLKITI